MHQQINLYQPIFRKERKLFSLDTVALALGVAAFALAAMWMVGAHNLDKLAKEIEQLKQQQATQQKLAESTGALFEAQGNPAVLQATVQTLSAQLAERTQALDLLRSGAAGEPRGFAPRLQALARQHADGVWLDELFLGGGNGLVLRGRCVDAGLLPKYLQLLAMEPELSGARFDEVVIDRRKHHEKRPQAQGEKEDDSPTVRFSVSSRNALKQIEEHGT
jgi:Tfp pilus assembly protein PilN